MKVLALAVVFAVSFSLLHGEEEELSDLTEMEDPSPCIAEMRDASPCISYSSCKKKPQPPCEEPADRVLIECATALILTSHLLSECPKDAYGLIIDESVRLPDSYEELEDRLDPIYLEKPVTKETIKAIKKTIVDFYKENDRPFTTVTVPKQCVTSGVLQMVVTEATLGQVVMEGNKYAHLNRIKRYISIEPGENIRANSIQRDLSFVNRNQFRHVEAVYAPGKEPYTTDIIVPVEQLKGWRLYAGADNQGIPTIRRQRLFTGIGINGFCGFDNTFNFQYTTAYYPRTFQSYTGSWTLYFPWKNILTIYGGYSLVRTVLVFPEMSNLGIFAQTSARYTIPIGTGSQPFELTVGFDYKRTNTSLLFSELFVNTASAANISQFVLDARKYFDANSASFELVGEVYYSPGHLISNESDAQYNGLRPGATSKYVYGKAAFRYTQWLPADFKMILWVRGQLASAPLLPSEQYGLGGFDTVRGYDEYQLNMDNAVNLNYEIRTPPIKIISYIRRWKQKDALQFLAFVDYGIGRNKNPLPGEASPSWLLGVGPGARYTLDPNVALRVDWGWKLKKVPHTGPGLTQPIPYTGGPSMVQFSATISY